MSAFLFALAGLAALLGAIVLAEAESVLHEILAFTAFIDAAILLVGAIVTDTVEKQTGRITTRLDRLLRNEAREADAEPIPAPLQTGDDDKWELYKCPDCGKRIPRSAKTCEHCGREILPLSDSPASLSERKLCARCGKRVSWNDPITWRNGVRYHTPCAPSGKVEQ